jgi:lactoylglutathione lyase
MRLAKPCIDFGLATNNLEPMQRFWADAAGLTFDHRLPIRRGQDQYRYGALGSVVKINHHADPLPDTAPSGYRSLVVAREDVGAATALRDPDGNGLVLVPPEWNGVRQIGVIMAVRSLERHRAFYRDILGFPEETWSGGAAFRAGASLILAEESDDAADDAQMQGQGWRYITLQVFKVNEEHARAVGLGAREALAPVTLGSTARISMIRDPDGNWIELSQRASIVGSLD